MDEVLHANIFFLIASVATVIFCIIICFILYQVYKIIKSVRSILERIESASEVVANDMLELRSSLKSGGWFGRFLNVIFSATGGTSRRKRSRDK
jgi:hypothetical protein